MKQKQQYEANFLKELEKLNLNQRRAVEAIEGPVMVLAGPGTGKTHLLSARIGQILQQTDVYPHNILCLTYTEAGTFAMRERLLQFIGPDAHKVHIYTFHAFCNMVIQDNLDLFEFQELEPVSDLERVEIIRNLIDELPPSNPVKTSKYSDYNNEKRLQTLFNIMKEEDWSAAFVLQKIEEYIKELPTRPEYIYKRKSGKYQKGDIKEGEINKLTGRMTKLKAAVALFPKYLEAMEKAQRYDFEDMLRWVVQAFESDEDLLRSYQEQYLYILVDEFQDTNGTQNHILNLLTNYWYAPNVFTVGDDDQAIYEFQGARIKNIHQFYQQYEQDIELVILDKNYRSNQPILDAAKGLIEHNALRLVNQIRQPKIEKKLIAANLDRLNISTPPSILSFSNTFQENVGILDSIETLQKEGVALNEIAIIFARHRQSEQLIKLFEEKKIPYQTKRRINVLDLLLVENIFFLFEYLVREFERPYSAEKRLFNILHFNFLKFDTTDLTRLAVFMANLGEDQKPLKWREVIGDETLLKKAGIKAIEQFLGFHALLEGLIIDQVNFPVSIIFERLINRSGILSFAIEHEEKIWFIQILTTLFSFFQKEEAKNPKLSLKQILEILDQMRRNNIGMPVIKPFFTEEGVHLTTAHSSKGLEFSHVFMIDCVKKNWDDTNKRSGTFTLPDTLTLTSSENELEARRRLFYVGMTRAKNFLQLSYSLENENGKPEPKSQFIDELIENGITVKQKEVPDQLIFEAQLLLLKESKKPEVAALSKAQADQLLEGFTLSATTLSRYLDCPLSFYYHDVLKVPYASSEAASYGTAVHHALKRLASRLNNPNEEQRPNQAQAKELFMKDFEEELKRQRTHLSSKEFERRLGLGKQDLPPYFDIRFEHFAKTSVAEVELNVRNEIIDGIPAKGAIDKIERIKQRTVRIVDYKTGKVNKSKLSPPSESNPNGGDYWRQIVFYKLLLDNYQNGLFDATEGGIEFIELDKTSAVAYHKISFNPKHQAVVTQQIQTVYQKIKNHEFYQGCGKPTCRWCSFTKKHQLFDRYHDNIDEELDEY